MEGDSAISGTTATASIESDSPIRDVKVFLCYRRSDGTWCADWLHRLLDDAEFSQADGSRCRIVPYFDQMAPGVSDWKKYHLPSLQTAHCLLIVETPGIAKDLTSKQQPDWVYEEIRWWIRNRATAPIVVDTTGEGDRWLPDEIAKKWSDLNRITVTKAAWEAALAASDDQFFDRIRQRIVTTVRESQQATAFEELNRSLKQAKRLQIMLAATACLLVAVAGLAWYADAQRREADEARGQAEQEARISASTTRFVESIFSSADPDHTQGLRITAATLLRVGAVKARQADSDDYDERVRSHALRTIASAYTGLGATKTALELLSESRELTKFFDPGTEEQFRMELATGEAYVYGQDDIEPAEPHLSRAYELARELHPDGQHQDVSRVLVALGDFYTYKFDPDDAKASEYYLEALSIDEKIVDPPSIARDRQRLAVSAHFQGRPSAAEEWYDSAIASLEGKSAPLLVAQILHDRAAVYFDQGLFDSALPDYRSARATFTDVYGGEHPEVAEAENSLGRALIEVGHLDEARELLEHAVAVQRDSFGDRFDGLVYSRNNLGLVYLFSGELDEALYQLEMAIDICRSDRNDSLQANRAEPVECEDDEFVIQAQTLTHIAEIHLKLGNLDEAGRRLDSAEVLFRELDLTDNWRFAIWQSAKGEWFTRRCELSGARSVMGPAREKVVSRWSEPSPFRAALSNRLTLLENFEQKNQGCGAERNTSPQRVARYTR